MPSPVDHAPTADRPNAGLPLRARLGLLRRRASDPRVRAVDPWVLDAALVLLVFVATFGQLGALGAPEGRYAAIDGLGAWLGFTATLPLLLRRLAPVPVLALTAAASVALIALDYGAVFSFGPAVALYTVARASAPSDRRAGAAIGVVAWSAVLYAQLLVSDLPRDQFLYDGMAWLVGWFTGQSLRQAAERRGTQAESDALRARDAERERRLVAAQERERLARDLHDSAGHAINVILVQAGAARLLRERDPERATTALETIEQVARQTIGDIDRLVGALRDDPTLAGPLGVGAIDTLVAHHRAGGLDVDAHLTGQWPELHREVDQAAYRIVQEGLTNAARHGDGTVELRVTFGEETLEIVMSNPVGGEEAPGEPCREGGGRGLAGMRERVTLLGGRLEAGPEGDTFRVHATLPACPSGAAEPS